MIKLDEVIRVKTGKVKVKVAQSCPTLCDPMDYTVPWGSPGQNTGVGSLSLLQQTFPDQESNWGLLITGIVFLKL